MRRVSLIILTLAFFLCFMMCSGLPRNITGIQAKAIRTKSVSKNDCPPYMYALQPVTGGFGALKSTMLIKVMRIDGAQVAEFGAIKKYTNIQRKPNKLQASIHTISISGISIPLDEHQQNHVEEQEQ